VCSDLKALPGPPVAQSFLDLGVVQTLVNRPSALQGKRIDAGLGKLWRTSVFSLNLERRCHFVATSGTPASMYGVASSPLSNTLPTLSSAALSAVWKSTSRCASELVFTLFVPWRAGPTAVSIVAPWLALRAALLAGTLPSENLKWIWYFPHLAGPIRACKDGLRRTGITFDPPSSLVLRGPEHTLPLLSTSAFAIRGAFLHGLTAVRIGSTAARGPVFGYLREGIDSKATFGLRGLAFLSPGKPPSGWYKLVVPLPTALLVAGFLGVLRAPSAGSLGRTPSTGFGNVPGGTNFAPPLSVLTRAVRLRQCSGVALF
jgi:hypothetical protein